MFPDSRPLLATLFLLAAPAMVSGARAEQPIMPPLPYQKAYQRPVLEVAPQPVRDGVAAFESACAGWAAVDRDITDRAAYAVLFNPRYIDVTSRRVQGFLYHEQDHWLMGQARVQ